MKAGAAVREFTPDTSQFLSGYPHVERMSEGIHDPLLSSALYLENEGQGVLFIANDILFVTTEMVKRIRAAIAQTTGLPAQRILISATHTHSGPKISEKPFGDDDPVIPPVDQAFAERMVAAITEAGIAAIQRAEPAAIGLARADSTGIGTNRHDPAGPSDHEVPVLAARAADGQRWIGLMYVCSMHPTVMHQDSRLVSADFPWAARLKVQQDWVGPECPVLHHTGCAGNQSPRHVARANTFAEAERIGTMLGAALVQTAGRLAFNDNPIIMVLSRMIDPPRRQFPDVETAERDLQQARERFAALKRTGPATEARTAECDVFGAEHKLSLAGTAASGALEPAYAACTPAEIQAVRVGDWCWVGWPSETYVEFGLTVKSRAPDTFIISIANGRLFGYITTQAAAEAGLYESGAALFAPETGQLYIDVTLELVKALRMDGAAKGPLIADPKAVGAG